LWDFSLVADTLGEGQEVFVPGLGAPRFLDGFGESIDRGDAKGGILEESFPFGEGFRAKEGFYGGMSGGVVEGVAKGDEVGPAHMPAETFPEMAL
jgi:hypothetical protein